MSKMVSSPAAASYGAQIHLSMPTPMREAVVAAASRNMTSAAAYCRQALLAHGRHGAQP
jgi:hypothetical protein